MNEEDEDESSVASDAAAPDLPEDRTEGAFSVDEAVQVMMTLQARNPGVRSSLFLSLMTLPAENQHLMRFDRFATALEQHQGGIQRISFAACHFTDERNEGMEQLWGNTLPAHPTLNEICLMGCLILPSYLEHFASSITPQAVLKEMSLSSTPLDHQGAVAIGNIVRRSSTLKKLRLVGCGLESAGYEAICENVRHSSSLKELDIGSAVLSLKTAQDLAASQLRRLDLYDHGITNEGLESFAIGLRSNRHLKELRLPVEPALRSVFVDLLTHFNFSLRRLTFVGRDMAFEPQIRQALRQNERVRKAHKVLLPRSYHVEPKELWPEALGIVSNKPTLVFGFLRRGNLNTFAEHIVPVIHGRGDPSEEQKLEEDGRPQLAGKQPLL